MVFLSGPQDIFWSKKRADWKRGSIDFRCKFWSSFWVTFFRTFEVIFVWNLIDSFVQPLLPQKEGTISPNCRILICTRLVQNFVSLLHCHLESPVLKTKTSCDHPNAEGSTIVLVDAIKEEQHLCKCSNESLGVEPILIKHYRGNCSSYISNSKHKSVSVSVRNNFPPPPKKKCWGVSVSF